MKENCSNAILFPTDLEPHSRAAFECALHLAAQEARPLIALHVCNMPDTRWDSASGKSYHETLHEALVSLESDVVDVDHIFTVADPGPEICRIARQRNCSMIVMAVCAKQGLDQSPSGGVHDYVQQFAPCTVVTYCDQRESQKACF